MIVSTKNLHILLTDDDPDESILFRDALEKINISYQFSYAKDGAMLLSMLESSAVVPDIIFLDLNMPGKSGIDCLNEMRKNAKYDAIPIIIYSTSSHPKDVDECYNGKANMYAVKCSSFSSLVSMLTTIFHFSSDSLLRPVKEKFMVNMAT